MRAGPGARSCGQLSG